MTWIVLGDVVFRLLTLALVAAVVSKTDRAFEAAVFIMAVIAYHRLSWNIEAKHHVNVVGLTRQEIWFRRLESSMNQSPNIDPEMLRMFRELDEEGLVERREFQTTQRKALDARLFSSLVTEGILVVALIIVLLR
jgi:hypothetical protein